MYHTVTVSCHDTGTVSCYDTVRATTHVSYTVTVSCNCVLYDTVLRSQQSYCVTQ